MKDSGNVESIASFSKALFGGLYLMDCSVACQKKFDDELNNTIDAIYKASMCKL
jgi:hypothetical protein